MVMSPDVVTLLRAGRWGALATVAGGRPYASTVAYGAPPDLSRLLLHVSRLAPHTQHLLADPRASLAVSEVDDGRADPQTLARVTVSGHVEILPRGSAEYTAGSALYAQRLPESRRLFGFQDFLLLSLIPEEVRYVGGFAMARTYSARELQALAGSP